MTEDKIELFVLPGGQLKFKKTQFVEKLIPEINMMELYKEEIYVYPANCIVPLDQLEDLTEYGE